MDHHRRGNGSAVGRIGGSASGRNGSANRRIDGSASGRDESAGRRIGGSANGRNGSAKRRIGGSATEGNGSAKRRVAGLASGRNGSAKRRVGGSARSKVRGERPGEAGQRITLRCEIVIVLELVLVRCVGSTATFLDHFFGNSENGVKSDSIVIFF